jgi:hypothetical protein
MEGYIPAQPYVDVYKLKTTPSTMTSKQKTNQSEQGLVNFAA